MHLGCCGKLILHCSTVPDDVREREAVSVVMKAKMKRKRKDAAAALEAALVEKQPAHAERLKQKLNRGIVTIRGGKTNYTTATKRRAGLWGWLTLGTP